MKTNSTSFLFAVLFLLWIASPIILVGENVSPRELYKTLTKKYKISSIENGDFATAVTYQLFVIPEIITKELYPIVFTVKITLNERIQPEKGLVLVYAVRPTETKFLGSEAINSDAAKKLLTTIGANEVFSLPMKKQTTPYYEVDLQLGGSRTILVRKDANGLFLVSRMDWESEPLATVSKAFTAYALRYFPPEK